MASRLSAREVAVGSAGVAALEGSPADPLAQEIMRERGLDISGHRARQLTSELVFASDLLLAMDGRLKRAVEETFPGSVGRVHLLGRWGGFEIPDPHGRPRAIFVEVLHLIERGVSDFERAFWS